MKRLKRLEHTIFYAFLTSIILFRIPNLYLFPYISNSLLTTQSFARIFIVVSFIYVMLISLKKNIFVFKKETKLLVWLIIILFLIQSFSILSVINMLSYLNRYKDVFVGLCSFFVFYYFRGEIRKILIAFILPAIMNIIIEISLLLFPNIFLSVSGPFFYQNLLNLIIANLNRKRIYNLSFDEIIIPLLFLPQIVKYFKLKILNIILFILIAFFAFASNIRSNLLMFFVSFGGTLLIFRRLALKQVIVAIIMMVIVAIGVNILLKDLLGTSFYDRLTFQNQLEDVETVTKRLDQAGDALQMAGATFFGVGLGNYYDNLEIQKVIMVYSQSRRNEIAYAQEYVHNIFGTIAVESGYFSLILFVIILILFIRHDISVIRSENIMKKVTVIAFWSIFSWGLFNPTTSGSFQFIFWGLRGLLL